MAGLKQPLSEELIKSTHKILTDSIDGSDGDKSAAYSGIYRTETVTAGFNHFTPPEQVPLEMKRLIKNFEQDIQKAEKEGHIDPFALSSK
jgi:Fic family protein